MCKVALIALFIDRIFVFGGGVSMIVLVAAHRVA